MLVWDLQENSPAFAGHMQKEEPPRRKCASEQCEWLDGASGFCRVGGWAAGKYDARKMPGGTLRQEEVKFGRRQERRVSCFVVVLVVIVSLCC